MEIWSEKQTKNNSRSNVKNSGYSFDFCQARQQLRIQQKAEAEIGKLSRKCQTLEKRIEQRQRKLQLAI